MLAAAVVSVYLHPAVNTVPKKGPKCTFMLTRCLGYCLPLFQECYDLVSEPVLLWMARQILLNDAVQCIHPVSLNAIYCAEHVFIAFPWHQHPSRCGYVGH